MEISLIIFFIWDKIFSGTVRYRGIAERTEKRGQANEE